MNKLCFSIIFLLFHLHSSSSKAFMRRLVEASTDVWENENKGDEDKYTLNQINMVEENEDEVDEKKVSELPVSHWLQLINKRESSSYILARALIYIGICILAVAIIFSTANVLSLTTFCVSEDILGESTNVLIRSKKFQKKKITPKDTKAFYFANRLRDRIPFSFVDYAQRINTAYKTVKEENVEIPGFKPEDLPIPQSVTKIPEVRMSPKGPRLYSNSSYMEPHVPSLNLLPRSTSIKRSRVLSQSFKTPNSLRTPLSQKSSLSKHRRSRSSSDDLSVFSAQNTPRFVISAQSPTPPRSTSSSPSPRSSHSTTPTPLKTPTPTKTSTPNSLTVATHTQPAFISKPNIKTTRLPSKTPKKGVYLAPPKATSSLSIPKIPPPPTSAKKSRTPRASTSARGMSQTTTPQSGMLHLSTPHSGMLQPSTSGRRKSQSGTPQPSTSRRRKSQSGTPQASTSGRRKSQSGTPQTSTSGHKKHQSPGTPSTPRGAKGAGDATLRFFSISTP